MSVKFMSGHGRACVRCGVRDQRRRRIAISTGWGRTISARRRTPTKPRAHDTCGAARFRNLIGEEIADGRSGHAAGTRAHHHAGHDGHAGFLADAAQYHRWNGRKGRITEVLLMLRIAIIAAVFAACASAAAQRPDRCGTGSTPWERRQVPTGTCCPDVRHDRLRQVSAMNAAPAVISHLWASNTPNCHHAALPADSNVVDGSACSPRSNTTPDQAQRRCGRAGRIIAIGCF